MSARSNLTHRVTHSRPVVVLGDEPANDDICDRDPWSLPPVRSFADIEDEANADARAVVRGEVE